MVENLSPLNNKWVGCNRHLHLYQQCKLFAFLFIWDKDCELIVKNLALISDSHAIKIFHLDLTHWQTAVRLTDRDTDLCASKTSPLFCSCFYSPTSLRDWVTLSGYINKMMAIFVRSVIVNVFIEQVNHLIQGFLLSFRPGCELVMFSFIYE